MTNIHQYLIVSFDINKSPQDRISLGVKKFNPCLAKPGLITLKKHTVYSDQPASV